MREALRYLSKDPRPQGGALNPKFSKPKTEIPKQVRDDKKTRTEPSCHAELVSASGLLFSAFSRHTFYPRPQDGVFRCDFNNAKEILKLEKRYIQKMSHGTKG